MQNNSKYQYLLSKHLVLVLYSCHGNLCFCFSILQSVCLGLTVNKDYEMLQSFVSLAHTFSCSVEVSFHFRNFLLKILADTWTWPSFFSFFSFCCVLTWVCVSSFFYVFSELLFSQSFSTVSWLLFGNEKFPVHLFHLHLIFTYCFFLIFTFLKD